MIEIRRSDLNNQILPSQMRNAQQRDHRQHHGHTSERKQLRPRFLIVQGIFDQGRQMDERLASSHSV